MKISLENLLPDIGAFKCCNKKSHISLRAQKREKGEGERSEQKTKQNKTKQQKAHTKRAS